MAQNNKSTIKLCWYNKPATVEIGEINSRYLKEITQLIRLGNDFITPTGDLDDEFWFLNARISGETTIITAAGQKHYPHNCPEIMAKLEAYLAKGNPQIGAFRKRGNWKKFDPEVGIEHRLDKQTFLLHKHIDENTANKVVLELRLIYHDWVKPTCILYNGKPAVRVLSWYLTKETLKEAIIKIINS